MHKDRFVGCGSGSGQSSRLPNFRQMKKEDAANFSREFLPISPLENSDSPASATDRGRQAGRVRSVSCSPVQEFNSRLGARKAIPIALQNALSGGRAKAKVSRNGISFKPQLLNPEGSIKRLTWWDAESAICQASNIGRDVTAVYDRMDCSVIHVLDENGKYLDTLPLKDKAIWFDRESTQKSIAETKRMAARVNNQLQHLHSEDSEEALDVSKFNRGQIENIVQTFPIEDDKAPAKPSDNATAMGMADASAKSQKKKYDAVEADITQRMLEEGEAASELLIDSAPPHESTSDHDAQTDGSDAIDLIL